jgi:hypothetical protein
MLLDYATLEHPERTKADERWANLGLELLFLAPLHDARHVLGCDTPGRLQSSLDTMCCLTNDHLRDARKRNWPGDFARPLLPKEVVHRVNAHRGA